MILISMRDTMSERGEKREMRIGNEREISIRHHMRV
jgi:hypothetical protein